MNSGLPTIVIVHVLTAQRETFRPGSDIYHGKVGKNAVLCLHGLFVNHQYHFMAAWRYVFRYT